MAVPATNAQVDGMQTSIPKLVSPLKRNHHRFRHPAIQTSFVFGGLGLLAAVFIVQDLSGVTDARPGIFEFVSNAAFGLFSLIGAVGLSLIRVWGWISAVIATCVFAVSSVVEYLSDPSEIGIFSTLANLLLPDCVESGSRECI